MRRDIRSDTNTDLPLGRADVLYSSRGWQPERRPGNLARVEHPWGPGHSSAVRRVLGLLALLLVAACAESAGRSKPESSGSSTTGAGGTAQEGPGVSGTAGTALPAPPPTVSIRPGASFDVRDLPFDHVEVGDDRRTLTIVFLGGPPDCFVVDHIATSSEPTGDVTLTIFGGPIDVLDGCPAIAMSEVVAYTLAVPLPAGARILDGSEAARR